MDRLILVTGITGSQGGATARHLLKKQGLKVRGMSRSLESPKLEEFRKAGVEIVKGNLDTGEGLEQAVEGVHGIYAVQDYWQPGVGLEGEQRFLRNLINAAKKNGKSVDHLVQASIAGTVADSLSPHTRSKAGLEAQVRASGIPFSFVRSVPFMENFMDPVFEKTFATFLKSMKKGLKIHLVAADDLGAAAAEAFAHREKYLGQNLEIAGDLLTYEEIEDAFRRVLGKTPKATRIPLWIGWFVSRPSYHQIRWNNTGPWDYFTPEDTKKILPNVTTFEQFVRQHKDELLKHVPFV